MKYYTVSTLISAVNTINDVGKWENHHKLNKDLFSVLLPDVSFLILLSKWVLCTGIGKLLLVLFFFHKSNDIFVVDVCHFGWAFIWSGDSWWLYVGGFVLYVLQKTQCPSLYPCAASPLWRNGQTLAQIGSEAWKGGENAPLIWSSIWVLSSLYCCTVNTITGLSATPGSRGIYFRSDGNISLAAAEFDFKLSLVPRGVSASVHDSICIYGGWVTEVAYICVWCGLLVFQFHFTRGQNARGSLRERQRHGSRDAGAVRAENDR